MLLFYDKTHSVSGYLEHIHLCDSPMMCVYVSASEILGPIDEMTSLSKMTSK